MPKRPLYFWPYLPKGHFFQHFWLCHEQPHMGHWHYVKFLKKSNVLIPRKHADREKNRMTDRHKFIGPFRSEVQWTNVSVIKILTKKLKLTHFQPIFHSYTPWNYQLLPEWILAMSMKFECFVAREKFFSLCLKTQVAFQSYYSNFS